MKNYKIHWNTLFHFAWIFATAIVYCLLFLYPPFSTVTLKFVMFVAVLFSPMMAVAVLEKKNVQAIK